MRKLLALLAITAFLFTGCATPGAVQVDPSASQAKWATGAAWVEAVADGVVNVGCFLGKIQPNVCAAYALARSELNKDLVVINDLLAKKATFAEVQAAINSAMDAYAKIEAAYRGQYESL